jgi:hypothetical protein
MVVSHHRGLDSRGGNKVLETLQSWNPNSCSVNARTGMGASWLWRHTEVAEGAGVFLCRKEEVVKVGGPLPSSCAQFCYFSSNHPIVSQLLSILMDDLRWAWVEVSRFHR